MPFKIFLIKSYDNPFVYQSRTILAILVEQHYKEKFCEIILNLGQWFICFVCSGALRPKSTAMVMAGGSVHLITIFPGQA